jgi:hypothetical protein
MIIPITNRVNLYHVSRRWQCELVCIIAMHISSWDYRPTPNRRPSFLMHSLNVSYVGIRYLVFVKWCIVDSLFKLLSDRANQLRIP